jgi:hypothetical protein
MDLQQYMSKGNRVERHTQAAVIEEKHIVVI